MVRRPAAEGRHRLLVAVDSDNAVLGYATTSRWRPKAAYDTTVESSIYCRPDVVGRGIGTALYLALFDSLAGEDIHRIVGGISQPNAASVALHQRCGFRPVGVFSRSAGSSASIGMGLVRAVTEGLIRSLRCHRRWRQCREATAAVDEKHAIAE